MGYDLLIENGQAVDDMSVEIVIKEKKIAAVVVTISGSAKETIYLEPGTYISAGWIDDHVHCFEKMVLCYDYSDEIGVKKGVTTVTDAGTTGVENIHEFYDLAQQVETNVFGLVNISKWGIIARGEFADLSKVQASLVKKAIQELPDFVVGIKARMSRAVTGDNGITSLELAKQIQQESQKIPSMVHTGSAPPHLDEILVLMEKGDILTHCFDRKENGILDQAADKIKDFAQQAYNKGAVFSTGHGTDSFNFHVAETALREGMEAVSISTDIYTRNRENGPVCDLAIMMEKLRVVGYGWPETIEKVIKAPAENFHLAQKGTLEIGKDADLMIFTIQAEEKTLIDSNGLTRVAKEQIRPTKTIIGGQIYDNQLRKIPLKRSH